MLPFQQGSLWIVAWLSLLLRGWALPVYLDPLSLGGTAEATIVLVGPTDPYYALAEEIAQVEGLPMVHTLNEALARDPVFLLWVASPAHLSDQALVELGQSMRHRPSAVSVGILSGGTLDEARALWQRAPVVQGEQVFAINAANPAGRIEASITGFGPGDTTVQPLTKANLLRSLEIADYLTFTGHGGRSFLALDEGMALRPDDVPALPPVVVATGSCNTFRPWEENSIALAFVGQGAAAYAGFAYSPNEGYLIGEFDGLPFHYTWPGFPIGHAVQVQNRGTLQGFARFPYYHLLGDPRIALGTEAPYRVVDDRSSGDRRTLTFSDTRDGLVPVHIPGGAEYTFVQIPGVSAAWERDFFYNSRLQMADIGTDKYVLFAHAGGEFTLYLLHRPRWSWVAGDLLLDSLDSVYLFSQQHGGNVLYLGAGGLALLLVAWRLLRRGAASSTVVLATLVGAAFSAIHSVYAVTRVEEVTITSKKIVLSPFSFVGTLLLVGSGAFLFLTAKSWRGRLAGIAVASLQALAPALFSTSVIAAMNNLFVKPRLGTGLWNYTLGLQAVPTLLFQGILLWLVLSLLNSMTNYGKKEAGNR